MTQLYALSTTAASNATADATINFAENQAPSTVNDSARALMARIAAWLDVAFAGAATYGGSGNAYTVTSPSGHALTAYAAGNVVCLAANHTNSGAATVNVDGLGARSIVRPTGAAMASGDIQNGGRYLLIYDGTNFQVLGDVASAVAGAYQPLDATLTALAALATSADQYIYATGSDTFALATVTSAARTLLADASVPRLGVQNTFSAGGPQIFNHTSTALQIQMNLAGTLRGYIGADATYSTILYNAGGTACYRVTNVTGASEFLFNVDVTGASASLRARTRPLTTTTGTLVAADANCAGTLTGGVTLPNSVFTAGDMQVFDAGTSARTITRGAGIQMFLNGTDVASATLAANQTCGVFWRSASVAVLSGGVS